MPDIPSLLPSLWAIWVGGAARTEGENERGDTSTLGHRALCVRSLRYIGTCSKSSGGSCRMLCDKGEAALRPEEKVPLRRRDVQQFEPAVLGLLRASLGSVHGA